MALFIYLESADNASWVKLTVDGSVVTHGQGPLAGINSGGERVIVFVPGEDVLLIPAEVPGQKRRLLVQAVPYILEEQLIDDVEDLHFALGTLHGDRMNVAVVSHTRMQQWLELLQQAGIEADQIIPDVLALPLPENSWQLLQLDARVLLRSGEQSGVVLDTHNVGFGIRALLVNADETRPTQIACQNFSESDLDLSELDLDLVVKSAVGLPVTLMASAYQEQSAINLLQGQYSRRERMTKYWRPWRAAAALLAVFVVVQFSISIVDRQRLSAEKTMLVSEIEQIYRQSFPEVKKVVNPKLQMERALVSLRGGGSAAGEGFADLLAQAGKQFNQSNSLNLQRINYKNGVLDVFLFVGDLQQLDQLKQLLVDKAQMQVEIQSATAKDAHVEARLRIKGAAS